MLATQHAKVPVSLHAFDHVLIESDQPYHYITHMYMVPWVVCLLFSVPNAGWKESQFYSLPFGQAVGSTY